MRIVLLVEDAAETTRRPLAVALRDVRDLALRGHDVQVVSLREVRPDGCDSPPVSFGARPSDVPDADLLIATSPATIEFAVASGRGTVVRYVTGPDPEPARAVPCVVAGPTAGLADALRGELHEISWAHDDRAFFAAPAPNDPRVPARIGTCGADEVMITELTVALAELGVPASFESLDGTNSPQTEADRGEQLRALDLFIAPRAPGARVTFAPAVAEAIACGLPCVLAEAPAHRTSSGGRDDVALFVDADDPRGVAEAVALLIRHRSLRAQLRDAGLAAAAAHDPVRHVDELERALAMVAARAKPPAIPTAPRELTESDAVDADLVHALASRAQAHIEHGRIAAAITCIDAAMAFVPESALLWTQLAEARLRAGDPAGALLAAQHAIEFAGGAGSCRPHQLRACAFDQMARPNDAMRELDAASRRPDATADVFREFARRLREGGELERARSAEVQAARMPRG